MSATSSKAPLLRRPARQLSRLHRWLGTGFCLLFALWFGTGFVMMYLPFPSLGEGERVAASAPVALAAVDIAPAKAAQGLPGLSVLRLRLVDVLGRPRYLATLDDGRVLAIAADDGATPRPLSAAEAKLLAERFAGHPAQAVGGPFAYDQWVVHHRFDAARPFYKIALGDTAGTELYVSAGLGQVLQRTTRFERGWNWVGAVVHWMYPTVLRKNSWAWDQTVWWLALGGIVVAAAGYGVGVVRLLNQRRAGRPGISAFRGWLRWHHVLGLTGGLFALTWVFSGWLSMDHGRLFSLDQANAGHAARFRGAPLAPAMADLTPETLRTMGTAREIEFLAVGGKPFVVQRGAPDAAYRLIPLAGGKPQTPLAQLPDALLMQAVAAAWAPTPVRDIAAIGADDAYGHTRSDALPASARRVRLDDAGSTWVHVDARSGQIISQMDDSRRLYRWLFNGLHSFDFPFLRGSGPLRQALMLAALAAGLALSVSALVLAARRLARSRR
ncbi:hypothetical protein NHH73_01490 [Oxalobacteraceae bacterium OTU3CINTB1]|nr:hypothetical protein NHH73_01490 [Oxalobacteraceae bacterium OTU3CINTB1]